MDSVIWLTIYELNALFLNINESDCYSERNHAILASKFFFFFQTIICSAKSLEVKKMDIISMFSFFLYVQSDLTQMVAI